MESIEKQQHPQHNTVMQDVLECLVKLILFYFLVAQSVVKKYAPDVENYLIYGCLGTMAVVLLICAFQGVKQLKQSEYKYINTESEDAISLFEVLIVGAIVQYVMDDTPRLHFILILTPILGLSYIYNWKKRKDRK